MSPSMKQRVIGWVILLVVAGVFGVQAIRAWPDDASYGREAVMWSHDTDPWLRLTLVRDLLKTEQWYDHAVSRSNAPIGGIASPWTRPLDAVIIALSTVMTGEDTTRLIKAALVLPMLWAIVFMAGLLRVVRKIHPHPDASLLASVFVACLPIMWNYFSVANADHHAPLAALFVWILSYLCVERISRAAAVITGVLLGIMLWISPEAVLVIASVFVVLGLQWILRSDEVVPAVIMASSLTVMASLAVMIERPIDQWWAPVYDSLSCVQAWFCALIAGSWLVLALLPSAVRSCSTRRLASAMVVAALAAAAMWKIYPLFFVNPMRLMDPFITQQFLPRISEARPLWQQDGVLKMFTYLWQPVLVLLALFWFLRPAQNEQPSRVVRVRIALLFVCCLGLCMMQLRWYYYIAPLAALVLMLVILPLFTVAAPNRAQLRLRAMLLLLFTAPPFVVLWVDSHWPSANSEDSRNSAVCEARASEWIRSGALVRTLGQSPQILFAPTNIGTEILYFTPYHIVASNYHREGAGIAYVWNAVQLKSLSELRHYLGKRKVTALLLCPDSSTSQSSVLLQLYHGGLKPPRWLRPVEVHEDVKWRAQDASSGNSQEETPKLFQIIKNM
jgi:hypothetical protein